jgi:alpha-L-fucosidase
MPQSVVVDLGESLNISGFTYLPTQQRYIDGTASHYQFFVSKDGRNWGKPVSSGEFSNIRNNPILQTKNFTPVTGRFIKFVGEKEIDGKNFITIADLGILNE